MRVFVLIFLAGVAVAALARWWATGRKPIALLSLVVLLAVPLGWFEYRWQRTESFAEAGISVIAGSESSGIRCQRLSETLFYARSAIGYVGIDAEGNPEEAVLTYEVCTALRSWLESDKSNPSEEQIIAVHVVAHEAVHLAGEFDESVAECVAMRNDVAVAVAMGATPEQGEAIANYYRQIIYPRLPSEYRRNVTCDSLVSADR